MKRILLTFLIVSNFGFLHAQKVNVAAAANLRFVLEEIKSAYLKTNPKSIVNITYGSTGMLVQQITNGAAFDFFMAADNAYPLKLRDKGLTVGQITTYAYGKLALYSTSVDVQKMGLEALKDPSIRKIAIANPQTAPYGERSLALLKSIGLFEKVQSKIVYAENISQAAQFAFTGNAELGFVALSLVMAPEMADKGSTFVIPSKMYKPVEQACVLIKTPTLNTQAYQFRTFVLSASTKAIWEKYGYSIPASL